MGSGMWNAPAREQFDKRIKGHLYAHPEDGPIRLVTGNQQELVPSGRYTDSGYYTYEMLDFLPAVERKTAVLPPLHEIDAEQFRPMLRDRLAAHGMTAGDPSQVSALKMSLALLELDEADAHAQFLIDQKRADDERRLRQQRYNAPLNQPLPAAQ